jgi:hypothetical protein
VFVSGFKGKRLAQLLDDLTALRMLRDVNVQDVPPAMTDDEEAERNRWHREEIHGRNRFPIASRSTASTYKNQSDASGRWFRASCTREHFQRSPAIPVLRTPFPRV